MINIFIPKKIFIVAVIIAVSIFAGLFYLFIQHDSEDIIEIVKPVNKPIVSWQKITVTEEENIFISILAPRVIISSHDDLEGRVNKAILQYIESLKNDFIFSVSTAGQDNGETNTLNLNTEVLLVTPRLISLAFTISEHLAGTQDNNPERTFLVFDLKKGELIMEGNELFRDDLAWSKAVKTIKISLLSRYQGNPNCDLFFAPKHKGFVASCIGVDWSLGGKHLSIMGDISVSMIQEFLDPLVLSDIIQ